ncbi:helix-turn-helix transcriptional regulator [Capnocytophaga bilenii]|jgi:hypothetical protein|uniref:helix-turn-helix domain-containing protein n=1 Tax=Capnocytophaga bilenii TaxID=2819369 RepID=UPI0028D79FA0|nr:helix-turn-helix transcriptional regulator [Capnocytophaga bilenii]
MINILRLKEVLKEKGTTSKELSELLGISETSISRIINGTQTPKLETLLNIATALNVDIRELFVSNLVSNKQTIYIKENDTFKEVGTLDVSKLH